MKIQMKTFEMQTTSFQLSIFKSWSTQVATSTLGQYQQTTGLVQLPWLPLESGCYDNCVYVATRVSNCVSMK